VFQSSLFEALESENESAFAQLCAHFGVKLDGFTCDEFAVALRKWAQSNKKSEIKTLSLFSGAGGLDIGFHDAGFNITHAVEIDDRFAKTLVKNARQGGYLQGTTVHCTDIRKFSLPRGERIDFIIGGPPCQTFSAAGRRASGVLGTQDARGTLFQEYVRLLNELKPEGFLFENVYGIVGAEGGKPWQEIQGAFLDAGYRITSRILDAADYGVAQHRERLLILGSKTGSFAFPRPTHGPDSPRKLSHVSAEQALLGCAPAQVTNDYQLGGRYGHLLTQIPPGLNYSYFTEELGHPEPIFAWRSKFSDFLYKADPSRPVRTLKAQGGQYTGPFHWESRPFTVSELKRLQSFPDEYELEGSKQVSIHQIGNSVPPQLARIMALCVREQLFGTPTPVTLPTLRDDEELGFRKRKRALSSDYKGKAAAAISSLMSVEPQARRHRIYTAEMRDGFDFRETDSGQLLVKSTWTDSTCEISVSEANTHIQPNHGFSIEVAPNEKRPWALGSLRVTLIGQTTKPVIFTALWKAFEAELIKNQIKADLVQLSEYYQYAPRFTCKMIMPIGQGWQWDALSKVVSGLGTQRILPANKLVGILNISFEKLNEFAIFLKDCGYEARSTETNPQIPVGSFLIPYSFPTLSPLSVQLRKKISAQDEK
jgi:DNA (cytosine-5)-methyltransferase 1